MKRTPQRWRPGDVSAGSNHQRVELRITAPASDGFTALVVAVSSETEVSVETEYASWISVGDRRVA